MDRMTPLLDLARSVGLEVRVAVDRVELRGPKVLEPTARQLLARKADLVAEVEAERIRREAEAPWAILPEGATPDHPPSGWTYVHIGSLKGCWLGPGGALAASDPGDLAPPPGGDRTPGPCWSCRAAQYHKLRSGGPRWICSRCHPPSPGALVGATWSAEVQP